MGASIKIRPIFQADRKSIRIFDLTGLYHSVKNTSGLGGGVNPEPSHFSSYRVTVKRPDTSTLFVSSDQELWFEIEANPTIPNVAGVYFEILNTDIGLLADESIPDGEYEFSVAAEGTFNTNPFTFDFRTRVVNFNGVFCCKEQAKSKLNLADAGCAPCREKFYDVSVMELGIDGIIYNSGCGKTEHAVEILKTLKFICEKEGCSGCN